MLWRQRFCLDLIPFFQVIGGPLQTLVQVALVATIRFINSSTYRSAGNFDTMTSDRFQQRIGRVGHVAVVAAAAGRTSGVVRVLGQPVAGVFGVTLDAGPVASHAGGQLVVGVAVVHGVTREA